MAYELIETIEVGAGGAASIEFTSIPQDGVDLLLVLSLRATDAVGPVESYILINNSTAGYAGRNLRGSGSAASSGSTATNKMQAGYAPVPAGNQTANTFSNESVYFGNYASSVAKSASTDAVGENNAATAYQSISANSWSGTDPITALKIYYSTWAEYSTASLYKIY